jgi:cytosine deaminase
MLEVAHMALHVAQMTSQDAMKSLYAAITVNSAKALGLKDYGLDVGCHADLVMLQARDAIEAIRLKAQRLLVVRRGRIVAPSPPTVMSLMLEGRPDRVDPAAYAPPLDRA